MRFKEQESARGFFADPQFAFQQISRSDLVRHPVVGRIVEACERYRA